MATDLERFRDHCREMVTAAHRPNCLAPDPARPWGKRVPAPGCLGCVTAEDRIWWSRLADEADAFLAHDEHEALFSH